MELGIGNWKYLQHHLFIHSCKKVYTIHIGNVQKTVRQKYTYKSELLKFFLVPQKIMNWNISFSEKTEYHFYQNNPFSATWIQCILISLETEKVPHFDSPKGKSHWGKTPKCLRKKDTILEHVEKLLIQILKPLQEILNFLDTSQLCMIMCVLLLVCCHIK